MAAGIDTATLLFAQHLERRPAPPPDLRIVRADIETDRVTAVRRQIPVLANRRPEAYG